MNRQFCYHFATLKKVENRTLLITVWWTLCDNPNQKTSLSYYKDRRDGSVREALASQAGAWLNETVSERTAQIRPPRGLSWILRKTMFTVIWFHCAFIACFSDGYRSLKKNYYDIVWLLNISCELFNTCIQLPIEN